MKEDNRKRNFLTIFFVAIICIFMGGFVGATSNMINGAVSPYYFKSHMNWEFQDIWTASVAQGIFEGLQYGVIFAIIFTTGFGLITKGFGTWKFALKQLFKIIIAVYGFWIIGGFLGIFLSSLSPDFYRGHFPNAPLSKIDLIKYAWVGGSINGGMLGGLVSSILGVVITKNSWKLEEDQNTTVI